MIRQFSIFLSLLLFVTQYNATAGSPAPEAPRIALEKDGIHDPNNSAIDKLQQPSASMNDFPKDRKGEVDWVQTLQSGLIAPRKTIDGQNAISSLLEMDMDILMTNTKYMPYVRFPHLAHTQWLDCSNCHPSIFIPQKSANAVNMNEIFRGEYCGQCHDKVSFSLFICERCHNVPHEGSGPKWW